MGRDMAFTKKRVVFRKKCKRDTRHLLQIDKATYGANHQLIGYPFPWDLAHFEDIPARQCSVAIVDNKIIGYICWKILKQAILLRRIAVHPQYQRQRIGQRLIDHAIHRCQDRPFAQMFISEHNATGLKFAKACGFWCDKVLYERYPYFIVDEQQPEIQIESQGDIYCMLLKIEN